MDIGLQYYTIFGIVCPLFMFGNSNKLFIVANFYILAENEWKLEFLLSMAVKSTKLKLASYPWAIHYKGHIISVCQLPKEVNLAVEFYMALF